MGWFRVGAVPEVRVVSEVGVVSDVEEVPKTQTSQEKKRKNKNPSLPMI